MWHKNRCWTAVEYPTIEEAVGRIWDSTWTLCTAFRVGNMAYFNDSLSEDGKEEYGAVWITAEDDETYTGLYVESLTKNYIEPDHMIELHKEFVKLAEEGFPEGYGMGCHEITINKHPEGRCYLCA